MSRVDDINEKLLAVNTSEHSAESDRSNKHLGSEFDDTARPYDTYPDYYITKDPPGRNRLDVRDALIGGLQGDIINRKFDLRFPEQRSEIIQAIPNPKNSSEFYLLTALSKKDDYSAKFNVNLSDMPNDQETFKFKPYGDEKEVGNNDKRYLIELYNVERPDSTAAPNLECKFEVLNVELRSRYGGALTAAMDNSRVFFFTSKGD